MKTLAIKGGEMEVSPEYRKFNHPNVSSNVFKRCIEDLDYRDKIISYDSYLISELQEEVQKQFNIKHILATNSGTSAILEMFNVVGVMPGDDVIVPVYTFFATATPLFTLNCTPVLVDCLDNGNIDPEDIERKITPKTKAIIVTHMWGIPCDMDRILEVANKHNLPVLEDSSHALGAVYKDNIVGTLGAASAWSLGAKKLITGGQGGIFGTNSDQLYQRAILLGHANNKRIREIDLPELDKYAITGTGLNLRMHPFSAAVIKEQFLNFNKQMKERREVAKYMIKEIQKIEGLSVPRIPEGSDPSWYAFPIIYHCEKMNNIPMEKFVDALVAEGGSFDIPGSTCPLTNFKAFRDAKVDFFKDIKEPEKYTAIRFPNATKFHSMMFKTTTWYGEKRMEYAKAHINTIKKVVALINDL